VVEQWLGRGTGGLAHAPEIVFWTALSPSLSAPLVAIWRNCSALGPPLTLKSPGVRRSGSGAVGAARGNRTRRSWPGAGLFRPVGFCRRRARPLAAAPRARWSPSEPCCCCGKDSIDWHSHPEVELQSCHGDSARAGGRARRRLGCSPTATGHLQTIDCTLPDLADCQGRKYCRVGAALQDGLLGGRDRAPRDSMIPLPTPAAVLYPRRKVLLLGTSEQVLAGKHCSERFWRTGWRSRCSRKCEWKRRSVAANSRAAGATLAELSPSQTHHVQIAGIHRGA